MYWLGFSNKAAYQVTMQNVTANAQANQILPAGPFGGTATSALMQTVILGLTASPLAPAEAGPTEIPWMWVAAGIGVVAVVAVVILGYMWYRRRPPKK
jgi:RsiW-degrading membrane proteinase PrsW (M82 family)